MSSENPLNIWGQTGCNLPEEGRCTACCELYEIPELNKPALTPCPLLTHTKDSKGSGCSIHGLSPERCQTFHCSKVDAIQKLALINVAFEGGLVTESQAIEAVNNLV